MVTVNLHEAKTQLSRLVDRAARGESFVIAKAGKPLVKVSALDAPAAAQRRFCSARPVSPSVSRGGKPPHS